uniref:Receptor protein serine/threonine kinase n=1 Tax=Opuntia streptacantha TaxID=393608 RepID=A0A7C9AG74_OPUST
MGLTHYLILLSMALSLLSTPAVCLSPELKTVMDIKAALDPRGAYLSSWVGDGDPCGGTFEGLACNEYGKVANISLQGKGLDGVLPSAIGELTSLSGLYLHFNRLSGEIPREISGLTQLTDLYLNVNNFSGGIPEEVGNMSSLQALQRLSGGFQYKNNPGLCGVGFASLKFCTDSDNPSPNKPETFAPGAGAYARKDLPESADLQKNCSRVQCSNPFKNSHAGVVSGVVVAALVSIVGLSTFTWYRRQKQKIGSTLDSSDARFSTDQGMEVCRRSASPLISLEYSSGWDPLGKGSQEVMESFMFNLEDVESATQHFSEVNFLGRSSYSAVYKGVLRDGSLVAIKRIAKMSCKSDEAEFLNGLKILTSLQHGNLVRLRGFCCSKGRGECFLIYDFVPNGNLLEYLDLKAGDEKILEWSTRVSIIRGIAKGIDYLHTSQANKPALVHQNISAEKVLIDWRLNPLLIGSGLHKLLADDIVFSMLKASAAMGYLAPEYTTTGKFTEKSDIYAFGMLVFQILSGKIRIDQSNRQGADSGRLEDFIDLNLNGKYSEFEAAKLCKIASHCTHELPHQRPTINAVRQELSLLYDSS